MSKTLPVPITQPRKCVTIHILCRHTHTHTHTITIHTHTHTLTHKQSHTHRVASVLVISAAKKIHLGTKKEMLVTCHKCIIMWCVFLWEEGVAILIKFCIPVYQPSRILIQLLNTQTFTIRRTHTHHLLSSVTNTKNEMNKKRVDGFIKSFFHGQGRPEIEREKNVSPKRAVEKKGTLVAEL